MGRRLLMLLALGGLCVVVPAARAAEPCTSNQDCAEGYYCKKAPGDCDGKGQCAARPSVCPDVWAPVCGCDGRTYGNDCEAAAAGVNVSYNGECKPPPCMDNNDCGPDFYCQKEAGACEAQGLCRERATLCPPLWDPICGCDGQTYANACSAARVGVNVRSEGPCPVICTNNSHCGGMYYCSKEPGDCGGEGLCSEFPYVCPDIWDPVCGCDGETYDNSCYAAMAGVNVDFSGECPPPGPRILMLEPHVADDDVHTGASGLNLLRILWSEAVVFEPKRYYHNRRGQLARGLCGDRRRVRDNDHNLQAPAPARQIHDSESPIRHTAWRADCPSTGTKTAPPAATPS